MLYTRKGDGGTTRTLRQGVGERISKSSFLTEALGSLDEINSLLGVVKVQAGAEGDRQTAKILGGVQQNLFIAQAELAGADKKIVEGKVKALERIIDDAERRLPPIKSFLIPGGTRLGALLDYSRAVARRAERRTVLAAAERRAAISPSTLAYLNRLSSLLYALARLVNHRHHIKEEAPTYA